MSFNSNSVVLYSSKENIQRAKRGIDAVDNYNVRYLDELVKSMSARNSKIDAEGTMINRESTFLNYMRMSTLYAEGKFISRRSDVASMAKKLANFEYEMSCKTQTQENLIYTELSNMWKMIQTLDGLIPMSQRPQPVDILRSFAD